MHLEFLVGVAFFVAIAYSIKVVVEARTRAKLISANVSEELLRSMFLVEEQQRRQSSLRWGIVLCCLAAGFGLIEAFQWRDAVPAAIALVIGATGIGNLVFYAVTRREETRRASSDEHRQG